MLRKAMSTGLYAGFGAASTITARRPARAGAPKAPSGPQVERPKPRRGGPSPWLVVGTAFAVGYVLAKVVDWRGHAHPRL